MSRVRRTSPPIHAAVSNPASVDGFDQLENPGLPEGPLNRRRRSLSIRRLDLPWHPASNPLVFKGGCL